MYAVSVGGRVYYLYIHLVSMTGSAWRCACVSRSQWRDSRQLNAWIIISTIRFPANTQISNVYNTNSNSVGPSNAILRHRHRSTLAHLIACCLTVQNLYLSQFSLIRCHVAFTWEQFYEMCSRTWSAPCVRIGLTHRIMIVIYHLWTAVSKTIE